MAPTRWIGNKRPDGQGGWIFEQSLSTTRMPLLNEHRLGEAVILSSTMVMDLLSQAASTLMDGSAQVLDLKFEKSIGLVRGEEMATQIRLNPRGDESWEAHFSLMTGHTGLIPEQWFRGVLNPWIVSLWRRFRPDAPMRWM